MRALSLDELIEELYRVFQEDDVDVDEVKQLMASYQGGPCEWNRYAKSEPGRYTRNLVDEGNGKFNLMVLCWSGDVKSSIHDHADAHCVMRALSGELTEVRYDWPDGQTMRLKGEKTLIAGDVAYINNEIGLHRVENRSPDVAVSLHLYSPPFQACYMFDENTGNRVVSKVTFHSRYGQSAPMIDAREP